MFSIKKSRTFSLHYLYTLRIDKDRFSVVLNDINKPEYAISISVIIYAFMFILCSLLRIIIYTILFIQ